MTVAEYDSCCEFVSEANPGLVVPEFDSLKRGGIVGMSCLIDCVRKHNSPWFEGPFGFVLKRSYPLPFRMCNGQLGFFDFDDNQPQLKSPF